MSVDKRRKRKLSENFNKEPELIRKRIRREDPDVYIKKAFGHNFEFSEEYLTSHISSEIIINALKKRYGFNKVTKSTLKHILYEGARTSRILRINNECYEKMIDVLNIKLESEDVEYGEKMDYEEKKRVTLEEETK